jgi:conjugal transfer pilus assembly protein TraW
MIIVGVNFIVLVSIIIAVCLTVMRITLNIIALLLTCLFLSAPASAKNLGVFGAVYDIAEKDVLKEIEEKARKVDVNRIITKSDLAKKVRNYSPEDLRAMKLQPARKERTFYLDMTYTLDRDIADEKGNVIYPRGYTFNPLNYITYPGIIVILDGKSLSQVAWFKGSQYSKDLKAKLLITDGSYAELSNVLKRPVFYANRAIVEVFQIKAVPSVVRQNGTMMEVTEIYAREKKDR